VLIIDPFPPTGRVRWGSTRPTGTRWKTNRWNFPPVKTEYWYRIKLVTKGRRDALPDMPLFLTEIRHVPVPLESTYQATWVYLLRRTMAPKFPVTSRLFPRILNPGFPTAPNRAYDAVGTDALGYVTRMTYERDARPPLGPDNFQFVDFDMAEPTNITTQGYWARALGQHKVSATRTVPANILLPCRYLRILIDKSCTRSADLV